jgi:hypothetical protein
MSWVPPWVPVRLLSCDGILPSSIPDAPSGFNPIFWPAIQRPKVAFSQFFSLKLANLFVKNEKEQKSEFRTNADGTEMERLWGIM